MTPRSDPPFILNCEIERLGERLRDDRPVYREIAEDVPSFRGTVAGALRDPVLTFFCGAYLGCLLTAVLALVWSMWL